MRARCEHTHSFCSIVLATQQLAPTIGSAVTPLARGGCLLTPAAAVELQAGSGVEEGVARVISSMSASIRAASSLAVAWERAAAWRACMRGKPGGGGLAVLSFGLARGAFARGKGDTEQGAGGDFAAVVRQFAHLAASGSVDSPRWRKRQRGS
jgi:hypothetical protein